MGYLTYYSLVYKGSPEDEKRLREFEPGNDFTFPGAVKELIAQTGDTMFKWYDWEKDMMLLASKFPTILFILYGDGEESDDLWEFRVKGDISEYQCMMISPFQKKELQYD